MAVYRGSHHRLAHMPSRNHVQLSLRLFHPRIPDEILGVYLCRRNCTVDRRVREVHVHGVGCSKVCDVYGASAVEWCFKSMPQCLADLRFARIPLSDLSRPLNVCDLLVRALKSVPSNAIGESRQLFPSMLSRSHYPRADTRLICLNNSIVR